LETRDAIGVIDSGVGGLSVVEAIKQLVPAQNIVYVADPLHFPYGEKTKDELMILVRPFIFFLQSLMVRAVVIACGTVSSLCLEDLRREFTLPIMGILGPACQEALRVTQKRRIMILATRATVQAGSFRKTLKSMDAGVEVHEEAWPELIEAVERGEFDTPRWRAWVKEKLSRFRSQGIDTIILGCTHFALISWFFEELAESLFIVNPAQSCAREVRKSFCVERSDASWNGQLSIFVQGSKASFRKSLQGVPLALNQFELLSFPVTSDSQTHCVQ
jgi:glutamate racemase